MKIYFMLVVMLRCVINQQIRLKALQMFQRSIELQTLKKPQQMKIGLITKNQNRNLIKIRLKKPHNQNKKYKYKCLYLLLLKLCHHKSHNPTKKYKAFPM